MTKRTDLDDVLDGLLLPSEEKVAGPDLSGLSLFELEALMGGSEHEKIAVSPEWIARGVSGGMAQRFAKAGVKMHPDLAEGVHRSIQAGLPATEQAIQRFTQRMGGSADQVAREVRSGRRSFVRAMAPSASSVSPAMHEEALSRLRSVGGPQGIARMMEEHAAKISEDVEYTGQVNNGIASNPEWPRAALGVDAAGRRATPEEKREQEKSVTPDVQHVQPQSDGGSFVTKGAHDEKLLGLFEKEAVSKEWVKRLSESGTLKRLSSAKPLAGPTQDLRNRVISKEVAHRTGADAARRSGGRHWWGGKKDPSRAQIVESLKLDRRADLRGAEAEGILQGQVKHERQRDAAHRVLQSSEKQSSLAAVGAALGRPF